MEMAKFCPSCGAPQSTTDQSCWYCPQLYQLTTGWSEERRQAHFAQSREVNAKARAEVEAEDAGKSDEEIVAGWEEKNRIAAELEPEIPLPAVLTLAGQKPYAEMSATERAEVERYSNEKKYAMPKGVPPLPTPRIVHGCTELTGDEAPLPGIALGFDQQAWWWGSDSRPEPQWLNAFPWTGLSSIEIEGPKTVESRVTAPRAALFGLFSLGLKKTRKRSYLNLKTTIGTRIFEVAEMTPWELRGYLTPVTDWFSQHQDRLQALLAVRS